MALKQLLVSFEEKLHEYAPLFWSVEASSLAGFDRLVEPNARKLNSASPGPAAGCPRTGSDPEAGRQTSFVAVTAPEETLLWSLLHKAFQCFYTLSHCFSP